MKMETESLGISVIFRLSVCDCEEGQVSMNDEQDEFAPQGRCLVRVNGKPLPGWLTGCLDKQVLARSAHL